MSVGATPRPGTVWIQGAGELASGVAWRLLREGYLVVMAEAPRPRAVRRLVCFSEAVYAGRVVVQGIPGRLAAAEAAGFVVGEAVVIVDPEGRQLPRLRPAVVVDGRMTKRPPAPLPAGGWPFVGLGPGFTCGRDAALVIETQRGPRLGAVIDRGGAEADTGVPGAVLGVTGERVLRAPAAGRLRPIVGLGELVAAGEIVGEVAGVPVRSGIAGRLRGLIHPDVELVAGEKLGDVDPRGRAVDPALISDKALAVGGGVLEALLRLGVPPWSQG
jgi:xanthine dehydrogenase accessory factor